MRRLLMIALCLLITSIGFSQEISYGAKAGLNISAFAGDDLDELDSKVGMYLGGFVTFKITDQFAVQPELLYSQQGGKEDDVKFRTDYLNLPVMAKFFVADNLNLQVGPQFGFNLKSEIEDEDDNDLDVKDETNGVDFSLGFGAEYELGGGLGINLRYNLGVSKVFDTDESVDAKHSVFQVGVAYRF